MPIIIKNGNILETRGEWDEETESYPKKMADHLTFIIRSDHVWGIYCFSDTEYNRCQYE